jgi:hypothetical protein
MIKGKTIHNFRGLRDVKLDGLARVNIIVGDNGSGKTSLLEAVFMAMSNSALIALALRQSRGLTSPLDPNQPGAINAVSGDLFGEGAQDVRIEARMEDEVTRTFSATYRQKGPTSVGALGLTTTVQPTNVFSVPVVYRWENSAGQLDESELLAGPPLMAGGSGSIPAIETGFLPATYNGQLGTASLFSDLDKAGEANWFIDAVRKQFSDVETVSVQLEGGQPILHAKLNGNRRLRPLELISGGLARFSVLLLMISRPSTEIVLVDEIEDGCGASIGSRISAGSPPAMTSSHAISPLRSPWPLLSSGGPIESRA